MQGPDAVGVYLNPKNDSFAELRFERIAEKLPWPDWTQRNLAVKCAEWCFNWNRNRIIFFVRRKIILLSRLLIWIFLHFMKRRTLDESCQSKNITLILHAICSESFLWQSQTLSPYVSFTEPEEKPYVKVLEDYSWTIFWVGINYNSDIKLSLECSPIRQCSKRYDALSAT